MTNEINNLILNQARRLNYIVKAQAPSTGDFHVHKHHTLQLDQPSSSVLDLNDLLEMGWVD